MSIKTVVTQLMTESDNVTHDLFRYLVLIAFANGLAEHWYATAHSLQFDMQSYGVGLAALIVAVTPILAVRGYFEHKEGEHHE